MSPATFLAAAVWPVRGRSFSRKRMRSRAHVPYDGYTLPVCFSAANGVRSSKSARVRKAHRRPLETRHARLERRLAEREAWQAHELERARSEFEHRAERFPPKLSRRSRALYGAVELLGRAQAFILTRLLDEPVWRAGDGRVLRIRDMNNSHLANAIQLLRRRAHLARGGLDRVSPDDPIKLEQLLKEARRRAGTDVTDVGRTV